MSQEATHGGEVIFIYDRCPEVPRGVSQRTKLALGAKKGSFWVCCLGFVWWALKSASPPIGANFQFFKSCDGIEPLIITFGAHSALSACLDRALK